MNYWLTTCWPAVRGQTPQTALGVFLEAGKQEGAKVINCNIFGGSMGTGLWSPAKDLEVYGCLVHDFGGLTGEGRGHGHAFYTQNETGTKTIRRNIAYRGCGWNLHIYTQEGEIRGFDVIENVFYLAGAYKPGQTMDNYLMSAYKPADRIRLIGNVGYQPSDEEKWRADARMANYKAIVNESGVCKDNYFMGAFYGLSLGNWKKLEVTGNTIWATGILAEINSAPTGTGLKELTDKPNLAGYAVDNNTYIANGHETAFYFGNKEQPAPADLLDFAAWQKLGLDKNGKLIPGRNGKPTGTKVFVFPNEYEKGRANVGVFNWDGKEAIEVDLGKVLAKGQAYRVYNCLDIKQTIALAKPVLTGTWEGKPAAFPMRKDKISPDFDAFLVLPGK